jgi:hypothetical protein
VTFLSYNTPATFLSSSICNGAFGAVSGSVIQTFLSYAANDINNALASHLEFRQVPLVDVPPIVLWWESIICARNLWMFVGVDPGASDNSTRVEWIQRAYEEVMGVLDKPDTGQLGRLRFNLTKLVDGQGAPPAIPRKGPQAVADTTPLWLNTGFVNGRPKQFIW